MLADNLRWLADGAEFALFEQSADGVLRCNEAALALVADPISLADGVTRATGLALGDAAVTELLALAERAGRAVQNLGRFRAMAWLDGRELQVLLVPQVLEVASDVHRRAAATDLSAAVSHELSNVLGAILGWASLARRTGEVVPAIDRALTLIERSARSGHSTARHLLDTARGRLVGGGESVDVTALVEEVAEVLMPRAQNAGVVLDVACTEGAVLRGHRADLFTVVWNLVQNAVEAAPPATHVKVSLEVTNESGVVLTVEDEGNGIPEPLRARVFEPYFTTKEAGTGLGLSLVRKATESLGGTIELSPSPRGACFICRFPLALDEAGSMPPRRASGVLARGNPRGKRILVVDDDEAMRDLLATALGLAGAEVDTAASGAEALATTGRYDLVLLDLGLDDTRGDRLLAELRAQGRVGVAALLTGASLPPDISRGGTPDSWLRKPFELDDLLAAVNHLLSRAESEPGDAAADG